MSYLIEILLKNDPPYFGGHNFLTYNPFLSILVRQMHQEEGSIYFLDVINNGPCYRNGKQTLP